MHTFPAFLIIIIITTFAIHFDIIHCSRSEKIFSPNHLVLVSRSNRAISQPVGICEFNATAGSKFITTLSSKYLMENFQPLNSTSIQLIAKLHLPQGCMAVLRNARFNASGNLIAHSRRASYLALDSAKSASHRPAMFENENYDA